jgi:hypothetical protein
MAQSALPNNPKSQRGYWATYGFLGRSLICLVLIFVIGMFANAEAAVGGSQNGISVGRFKDSAKARDTHSLSGVEVAHPAETIKPRMSSLNVSPFVRRHNVTRAEIVGRIVTGDCPVTSAHEDAETKIQNRVNSGVGRQQILVSHDVASDTDLAKYGIRCSHVDADYLYGDWNSLRNVVGDPKMFYADQGAMGRLQVIFLSGGQIPSGNCCISRWRQTVADQMQLTPKESKLANADSGQQQRHDNNRFPPFFPVAILIVGSGSFFFFYWLDGR